jgi:hypothetical protein
MKAENPLHPRALLAGLIVAVVGGIIVAVIVGEGRFAPTSMTPTQTTLALPTIAPSSSVSSIPPSIQPTSSNILFYEDFEKGAANGFVVLA